VDGQVPRELPRLPESERIARADAFFAALRIPINFEGGDACYRPYIDTVFMPPFERFVDAASFYSCLGHECGHAVGAVHRLNRGLTGRFGSAKYAMDEVVAELTSSFVMADLGIAHRPREEHAAYIGSWLPVLKSDPRAIFTAASKAQQAADWMHAQQPPAPQPGASSQVHSRREGEGGRAGGDGSDEAGREAPGRPVAENLPWPSRNPGSP
jgi:antirestriction protein ArdC